MRHRCGVVGQHGSIAVAERVIWSLKREWLCRVPIIRGLGHLRIVLGEFAQYHNEWRAHSRLDGALPALVHAGRRWQRPERTAKRLPARIEHRFFPTARVTAFRLPQAA